MKRDQDEASRPELREEHRRITAWITAAVWRQRVTPDSLIAATVVSDALDALGISSHVAEVGAIVESTLHSEPRVVGGHAVVLSSDAGVLADATFERFGTHIPYLVADMPVSAGSWTQRVGSAEVTFAPSGVIQEIPDADRALMMAQGIEVAGVGSHVGFDSDALRYADRPLFPSWSRLREAIDDVEGEAAHRLAAFRAMRNDHLVTLGYPWSIEDPYMPPVAIAAAA